MCVFFLDKCGSWLASEQAPVSAGHRVRVITLLVWLVAMCSCRRVHVSYSLALLLAVLVPSSSVCSSEKDASARLNIAIAVFLFLRNLRSRNAVLLLLRCGGDDAKRNVFLTYHYP